MRGGGHVLGGGSMLAGSSVHGGGCVLGGVLTKLRESSQLQAIS